MNTDDGPSYEPEPDSKKGGATHHGFLTGSFRNRLLASYCVVASGTQGGTRDDRYLFDHPGWAV